jgi:hypothetical protein
MKYSKENKKVKRKKEEKDEEKKIGVRTAAHRHEKEGKNTINPIENYCNTEIYCETILFKY